jgi:hypothetical protein
MLEEWLRRENYYAQDRRIAAGPAGKCNALVPSESGGWTAASACWEMKMWTATLSGQPTIADSHGIMRRCTLSTETYCPTGSQDVGWARLPGTRRLRPARRTAGSDARRSAELAPRSNVSGPTSKASRLVTNRSVRAAAHVGLDTGCGWAVKRWNCGTTR